MNGENGLMQLFFFIENELIYKIVGIKITIALLNLHTRHNE